LLGKKREKAVRRSGQEGTRKTFLRLEVENKKKKTCACAGRRPQPFLGKREAGLVGEPEKKRLTCHKGGRILPPFHGKRGPSKGRRKGGKVYFILRSLEERQTASFPRNTASLSPLLRKKKKK